MAEHIHCLFYNGAPPHAVEVAQCAVEVGITPVVALDDFEERKFEAIAIDAMLNSIIFCSRDRYIAIRTGVRRMMSADISTV